MSNPQRGVRAPEKPTPAPEPELKEEPKPGENALTQAKPHDVVVHDYGADAAKGMENIRSEEVRVPIFRILDPKSPQCKPPANGGIPGAAPGMIMNTASTELFDGLEKGFDFVPCFRDYKFPEYVSRDDGGGFVDVHEPDSAIVRDLLTEQGKRKRLKRSNVKVGENDRGESIIKNTEVIETFYLYGMALTDDDRIIYAALPFASTQIKKYQGFVDLVRGIRVPQPSDGKMVMPAIWSHVWHVGTKYESNKKGDFYGWVLRPKELPLIKCRLTPDDGYYQMGRDFFELMQKGLVTVDRAADEKAGGDRTSQGGADDKDEIPF